MKFCGPAATRVTLPFTLEFVLRGIVLDDHAAHNKAELRIGSGGFEAGTEFDEFGLNALRRVRAAGLEFERAE